MTFHNTCSWSLKFSNLRIPIFCVIRLGSVKIIQVAVVKTLADFSRLSAWRMPRFSKKMFFLFSVFNTAFKSVSSQAENERNIFTPRGRGWVWGWYGGSVCLSVCLSVSLSLSLNMSRKTRLSIYQGTFILNQYERSYSVEWNTVCQSWERRLKRISPPWLFERCGRSELAAVEPARRVTFYESRNKNTENTWQPQEVRFVVRSFWRAASVVLNLIFYPSWYYSIGTCVSTFASNNVILLPRQTTSNTAKVMLSLPHSHIREGNCSRICKSKLYINSGTKNMPQIGHCLEICESHAKPTVIKQSSHCRSKYLHVVKYCNTPPGGGVGALKYI